jgi:hypothetical protein
MKRSTFWKEACKFLSGVFFVSAGANWYFAANHMRVPFMGGSVSPQFLLVRGFIHFGLFLLTFYLGFVKKAKA